MSLQSVCETLYGLQGCAIRPLAGGLTDHTYAVEREGADTLILRVERIGGGDIPVHEQVLLFLEEHGYPAPRVVRALDGSSAVEHGGSKLVVTSFIDGVLVESGANTPAGLYGMGRTIGRLHALDPLDAHLPGADFMPKNQVPWAESRLHAVADRVPSQWRRRLDEMLQTLAAIPDLTESPACLVHNDCHPGNAVQRDNGEVVLIDWDGAGLGSPLLDLGFLLIAADTYTPDVPSLGTSDERVHAIVDGYAAYRVPDEVELGSLADAIRFRVTLLNALGFAWYVERGEFDTLTTSWWDGCAVADELATRVRDRFDEHRAAGRAQPCSTDLV